MIGPGPSLAQNRSVIRPKLFCVRKEELLVKEFVVRDDLLPALRDQPLGERVGQVETHMGVLFRIDRNHAVGVEERLVAFADGFKVEPLGAAILVLHIGAAIGEGVALLFLGKFSMMRATVSGSMGSM